MKKTLMIFVALTWLLSACASQAQPTTSPQQPDNTSYPNPSYPSPSYPNDGSSKPNVPADLTPAQRAAVAALSQTLGLSADQIDVISTESVTWPNGCLGVQKMGVMCTQAVVPGYNIILLADGKQYEFHTDREGRQVVQATAPDATGAVEDMVIKQLASNLRLNESDISVASSSDVQFPDGCLGVAMPQMMCAQIVTHGKIIVLEANGIHYEYHVNTDGSMVQPATLALVWTRNGGIAGFCDSLTVFLSGEIYGEQCKSQPDGTMGTFANTLSEQQRQQFDAWMQEFGPTNLDASDPINVSDRMMVTLDFYGLGKGSLKQPDQKDLFSWAQDVFQQLYK